MANKQLLWGELRNIADTCNGEWLVAGDLNDVFGVYEVKAGIVNERKARRFAKWLDLCRLMDLMGASGNRYTWRGPKKNGIRTF